MVVWGVLACVLAVQVAAVVVVMVVGQVGLLAIAFLLVRRLDPSVVRRRRRRTVRLFCACDWNEGRA